MRRELVHLVLLVLCAATPVLAQQEQPITVQGGEVNNGVVGLYLGVVSLD
jgi:hypothetical protein